MRISSDDELPQVITAGEVSFHAEVGLELMDEDSQRGGQPVLVTCITSVLRFQMIVQNTLLIVTSLASRPAARAY